MPRPKKYNTPEEKKEAMKTYFRNWYYRHKNDPEYIKLTIYRQEKYKRGFTGSKEDFMREYNSDYVFYIRNVRTGKFQKKIEKAEQNSNILKENIKVMKDRLNYLINKFGHLENKKDDKEEDKSNADQK